METELTKGRARCRCGLAAAELSAACGAACCDARARPLFLLDSFVRVLLNPASLASQDVVLSLRFPSFSGFSSIFNRLRVTSARNVCAAWANAADWKCH